MSAEVRERRYPSFAQQYETHKGVNLPSLAPKLYNSALNSHRLCHPLLLPTPSIMMKLYLRTANTGLTSNPKGNSWPSAF